MFRPDQDPAGRTNNTPASDVLLCVEIVSPSTRTADRYEKPVEYARNGIPAYWRIELEPEIVVHTYELSDGVYADNDRFRRDGTVVDLTLPWIKVRVADLLGEYA